MTGGGRLVYRGRCGRPRGQDVCAASLTQCRYQRPDRSVALDVTGHIRFGQCVRLGGAQIGRLSVPGSQVHLGSQLRPQQGGQLPVIGDRVIAGNAGQFGVTRGDDMLRPEHANGFVGAFLAEHQRSVIRGCESTVHAPIGANNEPVGVASDHAIAAMVINGAAQIDPDP